ncbi:trypsin-like peptidase domain-containing protein [Clostridium botulinum C]|uniref:S1 family peptidase n=1 Tax=Clostridium botulinum TaxID=1491 RepID=UPI001E2DA20E|nr:S1 family peptidase [Clostridium botulinum]MCD3217386.1 trypsin-like peptidase domain-containing protein [Clostridium botulinum C]
MDCKNVNTCCCYCRPCNKNTLEEKISYIASNEYEIFLKKANVVGVGLGYKVTSGFCTFQKCIKVFVTKKVYENELPEADLVPAIYKGIITDTVDSGYFQPQSLTEKIRPVICGYSLGPVNALGGTLGCLVTDGFSRFFLSNNHVLADFNSLSINTPILQPSANDGGKSPADVVGNLSNFIPLERVTAFKRPTNYVDCAIARLIDKSIASPAIALVGPPKGTKQPQLNSSVKKVGKTSELTTGTITAINVTYTADYGIKEVLFKNQIVTTFLSQPGDSGSVLLDNDNYVLGLIIGGSNTMTVSNNISDVLRLMSIGIVTN